MNWSDISISQFIELSNLKQKDFETDIDFQQYQLSVILNKSLDEIGDISYEDFPTIYGNNTKFLSTQIPTNRSKSTLNIDLTTFNLIKFNELSVGEFIDLENYISDGYINNLGVICAILYRIYTPPTNPKLYLPTCEPYGNWIFLRSELFLDIPITDVWGTIKSYLEFRDLVFEKYEGLFSSTEEQDEEESELVNELSSEEKKIIAEEKKAQETINKWGWDLFIMRIAKYDSTKMDMAINMNFIQALNFLSVKKELNIPDNV